MKLSIARKTLLFCVFLTSAACLLSFFAFRATSQEAEETKEEVKAETKPLPQIFARFRVLEPAGEKFRVTTGGFIHNPNWYLPAVANEVEGGAWSEWLDLREWPWHGRLDRAGGVAEWPAMKLSVARVDSNEAVKGTALEVQLADKPDEEKVVINFTERSESNTIAFLVPHPLREHKDEFETGSQMTARHFAWAKAATKGRPITLKKFQIATSFWSHYDPALEKQDIATLRMLGFNLINNADPNLLRAGGVRTFGHTGLYAGDPDFVAKHWQEYTKNTLTPALATPSGQYQYADASHFVISDEVSTLDFRKPSLEYLKVEPAQFNNRFRDYLRKRGVTDQELGRPLNQIEYPADAMWEATLPRDADLPTRRLMYHAAKFGQWFSVQQLRNISELIRTTLPGMKTETLLPSHGYFGHAWTAAHIGMSYRNLDFFEVGAQRAVSQLSAEDWLGLNHMYGPGYTWTGGQSFGYFNSLLRSAGQHAKPATSVKPDDKPIMLRGLITVSDDKYLRLKAYSSLAQGAKSFFFWTYGPTYIGTENYWSDLKSEYDGIAKLNRSLAQAEDTLMAAQPVRDPVAIVYSVSHDLWHTDNPAALVEKRLLWHALRHLQVQPDFLREEALAAGQLKNYKVLYLTDWNLSRKASAAIDDWVKAGGVLYLSAGAATRDEFHEPYTPPFARAVWPDEAAQKLQLQPGKNRFNERLDLPKMKPLATATVRLDGQSFDLPVLGARLDLRPSQDAPIATFDDGAPAGRTLSYGKGKIVALGFMPFLAYGQGANFQPTTLEEKWPAAPRELAQLPLTLARVTPVAKADVAVIETGLLTGPQGSALVLANYSYEPIVALTIDVKLARPVKSARSTQGVEVRLQKMKDGVRLTLPLDETDIVLLSER